MARELFLLPSALISNLRRWLKFSQNPKKELTFQCFYCCSLLQLNEAYLLLYCYYYSCTEYASRSIMINYIRDLDLWLRLKRSYWGWHGVLPPWYELIDPVMGVRQVASSGLQQRVIACPSPDHNYELTFRLLGLWALWETCPPSKNITTKT